MDKSILTEEINNMRFLFGYKPGKLISEQETPVTTVDLIKQIQTLLKNNYGAKNLGTSGPNKDGIDGVWGKNTQTELENAIKTIETAAPAPAAAAPSPSPSPAPAPAAAPVVKASNAPDEDNSVKPEVAAK
jgi:hypothetical protein